MTELKLKRSIAQPLPMDIRDWSFRGLECQCWDFSGRDIRGCDFRNAKLNAANFSEAIAGRSAKQQIIDIGIAFAVAFIVTGAVAAVVTGAVAAVVTGAFAFAFAFVIAVAVAVAGAFAGAALARNAIDSFAKGQILLGIVFSVLAIAAFVFAIYSAREAVKEFKNATGTDFSGACLKSVDFTDATLSNCKFDDAETSYVNWTNVNGKRSSIDSEYK